MRAEATKRVLIDLFAKSSIEAHDNKEIVSPSWLFIAFGLSAALIILGASAIIIAQSDLASGKRTVTMIGEPVCLPHKKPWLGLLFGGGGGGGVETDECLFGFLGENGFHYGIDYGENYESFWEAAKGSGQIRISGEITIPAKAFSATDFSRYDVAGVIVVGSATSVER